MEFEIKQLKEICALWGKDLSRVCPEMDISGSPERVNYRVVFADVSGALFVLEQVPRNALARKQNIAQVLAWLSKAGTPYLYPYLPDQSGNYIVEQEAEFWQIVPYVSGERLARPDYIADAWRGDFLAGFLADLRAGSTQLRDFSVNGFSLVRHTRDIIEKLRHGHDQITEALNLVFDFLEEKLLKEVDSLPQAFCHGDYHPLNVIWGPAEMRGVIDWEFCGTKPEIYDAALLISCVGIEGPQAFKSPLVRQFINGVREHGLYQRRSWDSLLECMVALRLAWLVEWLRKGNEEMLAFEIEYMRALVKYQEVIKNTLDV